MASLQSPPQPKLVFLLLVAVLCRHTSYAFVFPSHLTASLGSGGPSQLLPALKPATLPSAPVAHPLPSLHYLDLNRREDTKVRGILSMFSYSRIFLAEGIRSGFQETPCLYHSRGMRGLERPQSAPYRSLSVPFASLRKHLRDVAVHRLSRPWPQPLTQDFRRSSPLTFSLISRPYYD